MSTHQEKKKRSAAAWILQSLCTNDLWFDESPRKQSRNYLFIPLFDIAHSSGKFELNTLKESCYLLHENGHLNIWGDEYDPRAMLIQITEDGVKAYKRSFYGRNYASIFKKSFAAITAIFILATVAMGMNKLMVQLNPPKYIPQSNNKNKVNDASQKSTASLKKAVIK
ncbi:MAG TPA: hypothetical protein VKT28_05185 [Puia sp.]|nr:hypothetical protein [Puia sp.]